jgi:hypothetical protein
VQKTDVEGAPRGVGVGRGKIVGDGAGAKALAVHPHAVLRQIEARRRVDRKLVNVFGKAKVLGDLALRVVVATNDDDRDAGCP